MSVRVSAGPAESLNTLRRYRTFVTGEQDTLMSKGTVCVVGPTVMALNYMAL